MDEGEINRLITIGRREIIKSFPIYSHRTKMYIYIYTLHTYETVWIGTVVFLSILYLYSSLGMFGTYDEIG